MAVEVLRLRRLLDRLVVPPNHAIPGFQQRGIRQVDRVPPQDPAQQHQPLVHRLSEHSLEGVMGKGESRGRERSDLYC